MNAERMHWVTREIYYEIRASDLSVQLKNFAKAARRYLLRESGPPDESSSSEGDTKPRKKEASSAGREFQKRKEGLAQILNGAGSNGFVPSDAQILRKLGIWQLTGDRLRERIDGILSSGTVEQEELLRRIQLVVEEFLEMNHHLDHLVEALKAFGLDTYSPPTEDAEVGALLHLRARETTLVRLSQELNFLNFHFRVFPELSRERVEDLRLRSISNEGIFLAVGYGLSATWLFVKVLESITNTVNNVLEIKQTWSQLRDMEFVEDPAQARIDTYVEQELGKIRDSLLEEYEEGGDVDRGRRNELGNHLDKTLRYILDRVDKGAVFEVRVLPRTNDQSGTDEVGLSSFTSFSDLQKKGAVMRDLHPKDDQVLHIPEKDLLPPAETKTGADEQSKADADTEAKTDTEGEGDEEEPQGEAPIHPEREEE